MMAVQLLTKCMQRLAASSLSYMSYTHQPVRTLACSMTLQKRPPMHYKQGPLKITHLVDQKEYTVRPIKMERFAGRDELGRRITRRGGGNKRSYRMVSWSRSGNADGSPLVERVLDIVYDPNRSANLALVAKGEDKRYIIATQNMKTGDLIKSSSVIPRIAVKAFEGDSHPVGALPIGTVVNSVEKFPGTGGRLVIAAGASAVLVRKVDGRCILRMPSKQEINIEENCQVTVGRVGNIDNNKVHYGKAGAKRWAGFRPRSGLWQRKDSRYGRKIKPPQPVKVYDKPPMKSVPKIKLASPEEIKNIC